MIKQLGVNLVKTLHVQNLDNLLYINNIEPTLNSNKQSHSKTKIVAGPSYQ